MLREELLELQSGVQSFSGVDAQTKAGVQGLEDTELPSRYSDDEDDAFWNGTSKSDFKEVFLFLLTSCLGAGFLSLPYSMAQTGILGAAFLYSVSTFITQFGFQSIYSMTTKLRIDNYSSLSLWLGGPLMKSFMELVISLTIIGTMIAQNLYCMDLIASTLRELGWVESKGGEYGPMFRVCTLVALSLVQFLLTLHAITPKETKIMAIAILLCMAYCFVLIVYELPEYMAVNWNPMEVKWINWDCNWTQQLCLVLYAYSPSANTLEAKKHLEDATKKRLNRLSWFTSISLVVLYFPFALVGYLTLLNATPEVFLSRPSLAGSTDLGMQVARVFIVFFLNFSNVLIFIGMRTSIEHILERTYKWEITKKRLVAMNFTLILMVTLAALLITGILSVTSLVGGFGNNMLSWTLPCLVFFKLTRGDVVNTEKVAYALLLAFLLYLIIWNIVTALL